LTDGVGRIRVALEVPPMSKSSRRNEQDDGSRARLEKLVELLEQEMEEKLGDDSTFEERNDAAHDIMKDVLWRREDKDVRGAVTTAVEVEVEGKRYRRLKQDSSAIYFGRWGSHAVQEALYRELSVHNGPTIKPLELKLGMVAQHMTPDLTRVMGELFADRSSREVERTMEGLLPVRVVEAPAVHCLEGERLAQEQVHRLVHVRGGPCTHGMHDAVAVVHQLRPDRRLGPGRRGVGPGRDGQR
jgi:hypothetical protein